MAEQASINSSKINLPGNEDCPRDCQQSDKNYRLLKLNDDCLLELFKYLGWEDVRNLGETSERLKILSYSTYEKKTFMFSWQIQSRGDEFVDSIFLDIGDRMRSIYLKNHYHANDYLLTKLIQHNPKNVKRLKMKGFYFEHGLVEEAADCFGQVEALTLRHCSLPDKTKFLNLFQKLKFLNIVDCVGVRIEDLQLLLKSNPEIESLFLCGDHTFYNTSGAPPSGKFEFGPKLDKLFLSGCHLDMISLTGLKTTNLTKLSLSNLAADINNLLLELATKGILEELELQYVHLNLKSFDVLKDFRKLQLLVVEPRVRGFKIDSKLIWPPNLKHLRLTLTITIGAYVSTIQQLQFLQNLDLTRCTIAAECKNNFYNLKAMSGKILKIRYNQQQRLNIRLPDRDDHPGVQEGRCTTPECRRKYKRKYQQRLNKILSDRDHRKEVDTDRLFITEYLPLKFGIVFPGAEAHILSSFSSEYGYTQYNTTDSE